MNLIKLSFQNLLYKPLNLVLSLLLFALGIGLISLMFILNKQITQKFENNLAGIDLIIGAKGSPLQLVLNGLYHIDAPTGNISLKEAEPFLNSNHTLIKTAIPLSLGDSYKGFRIVGTTMDFPALYNAILSAGAWWQKPLEVTIGSSVASALHLKIGDTFISSHGLTTDEFNEHGHDPYTIVGIIKTTGSVCDQLILTSPESIWEVHEHLNQKKDTLHEVRDTSLADSTIIDSTILADRQITTLRSNTDPKRILLRLIYRETSIKILNCKQLHRLSRSIDCFR
jgi:putative ABC transport system permease protein